MSLHSGKNRGETPVAGTCQIYLAMHVQRSEHLLGSSGIAAWLWWHDTVCHLSQNVWLIMFIYLFVSVYSWWCDCRHYATTWFAERRLELTPIKLFACERHSWSCFDDNVRPRPHDVSLYTNDNRSMGHCLTSVITRWSNFLGKFKIKVQGIENKKTWRWPRVCVTLSWDWRTYMIHLQLLLVVLEMVSNTQLPDLSFSRQCHPIVPGWVLTLAPIAKADVKDKTEPSHQYWKIFLQRSSALPVSYYNSNLPCVSDISVNSQNSHQKTCIWVIDHK